MVQRGFFEDLFRFVHKTDFCHECDICLKYSHCKCDCLLCLLKLITHIPGVSNVKCLSYLERYFP